MADENPQNEEKQCRICLDGLNAEPQLGRLISPCYCKGSIRYVHVKCLERWRKTSVSKSAFFACPQCHYQYRFARTHFVGLAANGVLVAVLSGLLFICIVMLASFVTTYFISWFAEPTYYGWSFFRIISPFEVAQELITATFRVLRDENALIEDIFTGDTPQVRFDASGYAIPQYNPGFAMRFIRRFLMGLPLVGAVSIVHLLVTFQALAPVHWLARYRGSRRRNGSRDIAAFIVVGLTVAGAIRAFYLLYRRTEAYVRRFLIRAEAAILEVNS